MASETVTIAVEDVPSLHRRDLQRWAKKFGIRANQKNDILREEIAKHLRDAAESDAAEAPAKEGAVAENPETTASAPDEPLKSSDSDAAPMELCPKDDSIPATEEKAPTQENSTSVPSSTKPEAATREPPVAKPSESTSSSSGTAMSARDELRARVRARLNAEKDSTPEEGEKSSANSGSKTPAKKGSKAFFDSLHKRDHTAAVSLEEHQRGAGHVICSRCKQALPVPKKCPSCRQLLGDIRVRALELMAENVPYPCENTEYGCTISLPAPARQRHEEVECKFALFDCPNPTTDDCNWQGKAPAVVQHLKEAHEVPASSFSFGDHEEEWCLTCDELGEGDYWLYTAKVKGRDFVLHAREADGKFYVNIRSVSFGSPGRFVIRMKVKDGFEQVQSGPILTVRDPQHEGVWFGVQSDMIQFNPGGGMSIYMTVFVKGDS